MPHFTPVPSEIYAGGKKSSTCLPESCTFRPPWRKWLAGGPAGFEQGPVPVMDVSGPQLPRCGMHLHGLPVEANAARAEDDDVEETAGHH